MQLFRLVYFLILASFAAAYFSPAQLEILNVHYKIQPKNENAKIRTFYSVLGVPQSAREEQIEAAYKKMSRMYHPDKFIRKSEKERRKAERKFETLSLVITILRDVDRRKGYDYFIKNGFPVWDESKARYVFKNRSKPNFVFTIGVIVLLASVGQILILKLNKTQKNKRVAQILRDVRWKADNMKSQENKVMELPDNYELDANFSGYSVDDKLVTYCEKVFIVKPDRSVLLYNDETLDVNDESAMTELTKNIIESGHFNLYGFQNKRDMNRKERREFEKQIKKESNGNEEDIVEKLVQFKEDNSGLKISDLFVAKLFLGIWNATLGKVTNSKTDTIEETDKSEIEVEEKDEKTEVKPEIVKPVDGKITLSNDKVLRSRKK